MRLVRGIALSVALIGGACKAYDPAPGDDILASCCGGFGSCVPGGLVPSAMRGALAADGCGDAQLCAPRTFLEDPFAVPERCRALGAVEGRCLPSCLPQIAERASQLTRRGCAEGELCAPCYDPRTGEDTGACRMAADPGPAERPRRFASCCDARGECVPREILVLSLAESELSRLGTADCAAAVDALCVPKDWLSAPDRAPATCRVAGDLEGRCLSSCLPEVAQRADSLQRRSCAEGDLCVPCYDPLTGEDTGACGVGHDRPADPQRTFGACCEGQARCMPRDVLESVAEADLAHLDGAGCSEPEALCVPNAWLERPRSAPAACRAPGDLEGRCLLSCLPEVAARESALMQQGCESFERCVPCFDPRTGDNSGACSIAGDAPKEPVGTFDRCCGERASCVPQALAERSAGESALAHVNAGDCGASDMLCIPDAWLDSDPPPPAACRAPGDLEGRCLLACLPDVAEHADSLAQVSCNPEERCVPCFDPRTGEASGACTTGSDQPREPASTFADCCGARGSCVPAATLSQSGDSPLDMLGSDTCAVETDVCLMKSWLDGERPATCRAPGDFEGRCLPTCVPAVAAQLDVLRRGTCEAAERCVPCFEPADREDTGACRIGGDVPAEQSRGFDTCCARAGRCIPSALLSSAQSESLAAGGCADDTDRCVPRQLVSSTPSRFAACTSSQQPGLCIAECFLPSEALLVLSRANCATNERCVSCARLPEGLGASCP